MAERVEGSVGVAAFPRPAADAQAVLDAFRTVVAMERPDLVLTHSNGGRYAALAAPGIPVVHIDAALPPASGEAVPMAPAAMLEHLAGLGRRRRAAAAVEPLVAGGRHRRGAARAAAALADIREDERRMPLSYFRSRLGRPRRLGGATAGLPRVR